MKKLAVDLEELAMAMDSGFDGVRNYFDLETGEVIPITEDTRYELEEIYAEYPDLEAGSAELGDIVENRDMPDWIRELVVEADRVEAGFGTRYVEIPGADSREGYRDMEAFIETVENPQLANFLWRAISGKGAFRRFKDTLLDYPEERQRWFDFPDVRQRERSLRWLASLDVELDEGG